ncbi:hypothetical protein H0H93_010514 [Arthromyces matolae]|nr:hypothetical protein H0H93_010514 [Arthromyces matolae]
MSQWLLKRTRHTSDKRSSSEVILNGCGQSKAFLRSQWAAQVAHQTKPLPRSKFLEDAVLSGDPGDDSLTAEADLAKAHMALKERNLQITNKSATLGVSDRQKLERLLENPYFTVLMNMRAVKKRLLEKLTDHTTSAVKCREPAITRLARLYNDHCATITRMINDKKAPRRAQCPPKIDVKGLFLLDVDSHIWQDVILEDDEASRSEPPAWMAVENVWEGIKALLEHDRCAEEQDGFLRSGRLLTWQLQRLTIIMEPYINFKFDAQISADFAFCGKEWGPTTQDQLEMCIAHSTALVVDEESEEEEEDLDMTQAYFDSENDLFEDF